MLNDYVLSCIATIELLLRRTLQRSELIQHTTFNIQHDYEQ
jgi:hypothetical protein